MEILGYKYNNEEDAIIACKKCADYYGLPLTPDDVTQYWVDYNIANLNNPIFCYIIYDQSIENILGIPETFDVIEPLITIL